jgi:26S proteasome regulatory subunit N8
MPATTTAETLALTSTQVIVHPLVLLSAVDHYMRATTGATKRVVGILLGQNNGSTINVANSFAGVCTHLRMLMQFHLRRMIGIQPYGS